MRRQLASGSQIFDVVGAVNGLRQLIAKAEAFATTADDLFEDVKVDTGCLTSIVGGAP